MNHEEDDFELELDLDADESSIIILEESSSSGVYDFKPENDENDVLTKTLNSGGEVVKVEDGKTVFNLDSRASMKTLADVKNGALLLGTSGTPATLTLGMGDDEDFEIDMDEETNMSIQDDLEVDMDEEDNSLIVVGGGYAGSYELSTLSDEEKHLMELKVLSERYPYQEDELKAISRTCREIHNSIYDPDKYKRHTKKLLKDYLEDPKFNFFPKHTKVKNEYTGENSFYLRTILNKLFEDYMDKILTEVIVPGEKRKDHVQEALRYMSLSMQGVYMRELDQDEYATMEALVRDYFNLGVIHHEQMHKITRDLAYKPQYTELHTPTLVTNMEYKCTCGEFVPMNLSDGGRPRPTLCFFVPKDKGGSIRLMNEPVQCSCGQWLALPQRLASRLESKVDEITPASQNPYSDYRIYRPSLAVLKSVIPSDAEFLFQLESASSDIVKIKSKEDTSLEEIAYRRLMKTWMSKQVTAHSLETLKEDSITQNPFEQHLAETLTKVQYSKDITIEANQFRKTLVHVLESFSLFALTPEKLALYNVYEKEGYNRTAFDTDYAIRWMREYAQSLAGLRNMFKGDMDMNDLVILPEYYEVINFITMLHIASDETRVTGNLAAYVKNPASSSPRLIEIMERFNSPSKTVSERMRCLLNPMRPFPNGYRLPRNKRGMRDSGIEIPTGAWSDLYTFCKELKPLVETRYHFEDNDIELFEKAQTMTMEEFYGVKIDEKQLVQPTLMKHKFEEFMLKYGHLLLTGLIMDEPRRAVATYIILTDYFKLAKQGEEDKGYSLENILNVSEDATKTDLNKVLLTNANGKQYNEKELCTIHLTAILGSIDLPTDIQMKFEEHGLKTLVANWEEHKETFLANTEFMNKYGEVLSCCF